MLISRLIRVVALDHGCALGSSFGRQVRRNRISVLRLIRELIEGVLNTIFALLIFAVAAYMLWRSAVAIWNGI